MGKRDGEDAKNILASIRACKIIKDSMDSKPMNGFISSICPLNYDFLNDVIKAMYKDADMLANKYMDDTGSLRFMVSYYHEIRNVSYQGCSDLFFYTKRSVARIIKEYRK